MASHLLLHSLLLCLIATADTLARLLPAAHATLPQSVKGLGPRLGVPSSLAAAGGLSQAGGSTDRRPTRRAASTRYRPGSPISITPVLRLATQAADHHATSATSVRTSSAASGGLRGREKDVAQAQAMRGRSLSGLANLGAASVQLDASGTSYQIGSKDSRFGTMTYQGGKILSGAVPVYIIYYGNWPAGSGQTIMENFINSINDSTADGKGTSVREWFNVHSLYKTPTNDIPATNIYLAGTHYNTSTAPLYGDYQVRNAVLNFQYYTSTPDNSNALYVVLSSSGIQQEAFAGTPGSFCSDFCGWHRSYYSGDMTSKLNIIYAGWAADCNSGCYPFSQSINNNKALDGMVNTVAGEISKMVTNVNGDGFRDTSSGQDNADGCAWFYQKMPTSSEPYYNTYGSNGMKFLIQSNMHPTSNTCVHGLDIPVPSPPPPPPTPPTAVVSQCAASSSSSGSTCPCEGGTSTKDGCVCSQGACVSFCLANNGKRCKACRGKFCKCRSGACKTLFSRLTGSS